VADPIIDAALDNLDEEAAAYRAALSHSRRYARYDQQIFRKRLSDYLQRRGFAYGIIRDVVDRLWEEQAAGGATHSDNDTDN
jgi:SOS response regulatory protein OraA/RecX